MINGRLRVQNTGDALEKTRMLAYNFYTARNPSGVTCFYDDKEVCWFGSSAMEEAYNFTNLQIAIGNILNDMPGFELVEEEYQVLYGNERVCLVSGSFELQNDKIMTNLKRMSCFWVLKNGEWRLSRLRLNLPRKTDMEDGTQEADLADEMIITKKKNEALVAMSDSSVMEYSVETDKMELYLPDEDGRKKYHVMKKYSQTCQKEIEMRIHPEDLKKVQGTFYAQQGQRTIEYRFLGEEGIYSWYRMSCQKIFDSKGKLRKVMGAISDISRERELMEEAQKDSLTGAYNRHGLDIMVENYRKYLLCQGRGIKGAALMLDLDNFKSLNDAFGHMVGDQVLKEMVRILKSRFRSDDRIFRMGGDEFLILMKDIPDEGVVRRKGEEVIREFTEYASQYVIPDKTVSLSIGAVVFDQNVAGSSELYRQADSALYQVKKNGKKGILFYHGE